MPLRAATRRASRLVSLPGAMILLLVFPVMIGLLASVPLLQASTGAPEVSVRDVSHEAAGAGSQPVERSVVLLDDHRPVADLWPSLGVLSDPDRTLSIEQVSARRHEFTSPADRPRWNFGDPSDQLWFHLPLQVLGGDGRWILSIDYSALQHVDLYLVRNDALRLHRRLGSRVHSNDPESFSRIPATEISLVPGSYDLYLRIDTETSVIVPIELQKPRDYHQQEQTTLLIMGVSAGISMALIVYSLFQWRGLRESMFAFYAGHVLFMTLFFMTFNGVFAHLLAPIGLLMPPSLLPWLVLAALVFGCLFVTRSLSMYRLFPRVHKAMMVLACTVAFCLVLSLPGVLDYHQSQLATSLLGPLLPLLAVPVAFRRLRAGDEAATCMLLGWVGYLVGAVTFAGMLRGVFPIEFWSVHLFQIGGQVEMLLWLRVLGLHIRDVRRSAERAEVERQTLMTLARSDALTGLVNRRGLMPALEQRLKALGENDLLAVYFLDLDGFKAINDQHGHEIGDRVLVDFSKRLEQRLRQNDLAARLGGDEFLVVATSINDSESAGTLGDRLLAIVDEPCVIDSIPCHIGVTVGYALASRDSVDIDTLIKRADKAMYAGKMAGKRCVLRFDDNLQKAA